MPFDPSTTKSFQEAMNEIMALTVYADTEEEAEQWKKVSDELWEDRKKVIKSDFASRTFAYNIILSRLGSVCAELSKDHYRDLKRKLQGRLLELRGRLMNLAVDALDQFHGLQIPAELDAEEEDPKALKPKQSPKTGEPEDDSEIPAAAAMEDAAAMTSTKPSQVREDLRTDYESLFATCVMRPDKLGSINWHKSR